MRNSSTKPRSANKTFFSDLILKATEHSKKLTVIDTLIYCVLMVALIVLMVWRTAIAEHCVNAMLYVTTTYVSLRLGYSFKSGLENV